MVPQNKKLLSWCILDISVFQKKIRNMRSVVFLSDVTNCFVNGEKVIHHSHVNREIYGYVHSFSNKKVREMSENSGQYFSCVFHNGFRFDMTFLTKVIWLSLWKMQEVSLLGSSLTEFKSYTLGRHRKFIDSVKYYQQSLAKLAKSPNEDEKIRIVSFFFRWSRFSASVLLRFFYAWTVWKC